MRVGEIQKKAARVADLYSYLLQYHADSVKSDGTGRLQHRTHNSLIITKGKGFVHNSEGVSGNGIDYLMKYEGYSFQRAVAALAAFGGVSDGTPTFATSVAYRAPEAFLGAYARVYAYLTQTRNIPPKVVSKAIESKILYEDNQHNCVFAGEGFAERVGTLTKIKFKQIVPGSRSDGYWVIGSTDPKTVYVTEAPIDAMSLYAIIASDDIAVASMSGLKDAALNRIVYDYPISRIVLAVDKDDAGDAFAAKHQDIERIVPNAGKDWNDSINSGF